MKYPLHEKLALKIDGCAKKCLITSFKLPVSLCILSFQNQINERAKFPTVSRFINSSVPLCFIGKHCNELNRKIYRALEDTSKLRRQDISTQEDLSQVEQPVGDNADFKLLKFVWETPGRFLVNQINT